MKEIPKLLHLVRRKIDASIISSIYKLRSNHSLAHLCLERPPQYVSWAVLDTRGAGHVPSQSHKPPSIGLRALLRPTGDQTGWADARAGLSRPAARKKEGENRRTRKSLRCPTKMRQGCCRSSQNREQGCKTWGTLRAATLMAHLWKTWTPDSSKRLNPWNLKALNTFFSRNTLPGVTPKPETRNPKPQTVSL